MSSIPIHSTSSCPSRGMSLACKRFSFQPQVKLTGGRKERTRSHISSFQEANFAIVTLAAEPSPLLSLIGSVSVGLALLGLASTMQTAKASFDTASNESKSTAPPVSPPLPERPSVQEPVITAEPVKAEPAKAETVKADQPSTASNADPIPSAPSFQKVEESSASDVAAARAWIQAYRERNATAVADPVVSVTTEPQSKESQSIAPVVIPPRVEVVNSSDASKSDDSTEVKVSPGPDISSLYTRASSEVNLPSRPTASEETTDRKDEGFFSKLLSWLKQIWSAISKFFGGPGIKNQGTSAAA